MTSSIKKYILSLVILLWAYKSHGQNPTTFNQFTLNPFQFNPSYAANNGYTEANLFFRKQWLGIENAPTSGSFNIQSPVGRNVSLGLSLISNNTILLNTNSALVTFAYRVRLSNNHHINFGLSSGIEINNFDLDAVANTNDPVLLNVLEKSTNVAGQFGINYQYKNLNIGFALPSLFESKSNSTQEFQNVKFNALLNKFGSISYNINLSDVVVNPTILYRAIDNEQDQWEGLIMATYKKFIWVGLSYRDGYGLTGMIGMRLKGNYRVGYAYEYPTTSISKASNGSHEIYLGARIGKYNREEQLSLYSINEDTLGQITPVEIPEIEQEEKKLKVEEPQPIIVIDSVKQIVSLPPSEIKPEIQVNSATIEKEKQFYIVIGAYRKQQNALNQLNKLQEQNVIGGVLYLQNKKLYLVYIFAGDEKDKAIIHLNEIRESGKYPGAWIYNNK